MRLLLSTLLLLATVNAVAMPHDEPELHFYSDGTTALGLVYSEGTNSAVNPKAHRILEEIYVCQSGKKIADLKTLKALADSDGTYVVGKDTTGGSIQIERYADEAWVLNSTLTRYKYNGSGDALVLKQTASGVLGFELDWDKDPCVPKKEI